MKTVTRLSLALAVLSLAAPAVAAPDAVAPDAVAPGPRLAQADEELDERRARRLRGLSPEERKALKGEVRQKMQTHLAEELSRRLGLDAQKSAALADAIKRQGEAREARGKALRQEMQALQRLVEGPASERELVAQMDRVKQARAAKEGMDGLLEQASRFLSTAEQARLMLALPAVMRDARRMMKEARRKHRRAMRRGMGSGGFGGEVGVEGDEGL